MEKIRNHIQFQKSIGGKTWLLRAYDLMQEDTVATVELNADEMQSLGEECIEKANELKCND